MFIARLDASNDAFGLSAVAATAEEAERLIREEYEAEGWSRSWEEAKENWRFEFREFEIGNVYWDSIPGVARE